MTPPATDGSAPLPCPDDGTAREDRETMPGPPIPENGKHPVAEPYWKRPTL